MWRKYFYRWRFYFSLKKMNNKKVLFIKSKIKNYKIVNKKKVEFKNKQNYIYIIDQNFFNLNQKIFQNNIKKILINPNERKKSFEFLPNIFKEIFQFKITKKSKIISIGGGIIQDISGFCASIIFRGIKWDFYPTTLLAQGDSCIGGKTSINLLGAKNQLGNFYPPNTIYININFLKTLKNNDIISGLGEMAHYYLQSSRLDQFFFKYGVQQVLDKNYKVLELLIFKCLKIKKKFIESDEFDNGKRLLLNYGHSFGHALEKLTNYKCPHGIAVSIGIGIANYISYKKKYLNKKDFIFMQSILSKINKDYALKNFNIDKFLKYLELDKKNTVSHYGLILTKGSNKTFLKKIEKKDKKIKLLIQEYVNRFVD